MKNNDTILLKNMTKDDFTLKFGYLNGYAKEILMEKYKTINVIENSFEDSRENLFYNIINNISNRENIIDAALMIINTSKYFYKENIEADYEIFGYIDEIGSKIKFLKEYADPVFDYDFNFEHIRKNKKQERCFRIRHLGANLFLSICNYKEDCLKTIKDLMNINIFKDSDKNKRNLHISDIDNTYNFFKNLYNNDLRKKHIQLSTKKDKEIKTLKLDDDNIIADYFLIESKTGASLAGEVLNFLYKYNLNLKSKNLFLSFSNALMKIDNPILRKLIFEEVINMLYLCKSTKNCTPLISDNSFEYFNIPSGKVEVNKESNLFVQIYTQIESKEIIEETLNFFKSEELSSVQRNILCFWNINYQDLFKKSYNEIASKYADKNNCIKLNNFIIKEIIADLREKLRNEINRLIIPQDLNNVNIDKLLEDILIEFFKCLFDKFKNKICKLPYYLENDAEYESLLQSMETEKDNYVDTLKKFGNLKESKDKVTKILDEFFDYFKEIFAKGFQVEKIYDNVDISKISKNKEEEYFKYYNSLNNLYYFIITESKDIDREKLKEIYSCMYGILFQGISSCCKDFINALYSEIVLKNDILANSDLFNNIHPEYLEFIFDVIRNVYKGLSINKKYALIIKNIKSIDFRYYDYLYCFKLSIKTFDTNSIKKLGNITNFIFEEYNKINKWFYEFASDCFITVKNNNSYIEHKNNFENDKYTDFQAYYDRYYKLNITYETDDSFKKNYVYLLCILIYARKNDVKSAIQRPLLNLDFDKYISLLSSAMSKYDLHNIFTCCEHQKFLKEIHHYNTH